MPEIPAGFTEICMLCLALFVCTVALLFTLAIATDLRMERTIIAIRWALTPLAAVVGFAFAAALWATSLELLEVDSESWFDVHPLQWLFSFIAGLLVVTGPYLVAPSKRTTVAKFAFVGGTVVSAFLTYFLFSSSPVLGEWDDYAQFLLSVLPFLLSVLGGLVALALIPSNRRTINTQDNGSRPATAV